ncbi:ATP-dependent RNA helicase DDX24-like [Clavelina lepadiformis]|uniref:ATP-dependent RNA helicase DDX24-like n=1 Tax=Clavelina lepadiformis TaxID=159417 RepID=UPI0040417435
MNLSDSVKSINERSSWKAIPLAVGPNVPYFNDLVEFEELDSYDLVSAGQSPPVAPSIKKTKKASLKKKRQQKQKAKLRQVLLASNNNDEESLQPVTDSPDDKSSSNDADDAINSKPAKIKTRKRELKTENANETPKKVSKVEDTKKDMSHWDNLFVPEVVLKALSELDFLEPMEIQRQVLPVAIRDKRDVLGAAETGSGKTLAFGIPLIHNILADRESNSNQAQMEEAVHKECDSDYDEEDIFLGVDESITDTKSNVKTLPALILAPTRELAIQVSKHIKNVAKYTGLRAITIVGGMAPQKQVRQLKTKPDIVIATPGRLWELLETGHPYLSSLHRLSYLVIDEADRMLEKGHFEDLNKLFDIINAKEANKKRQTFVFSATLTTVHLGPSRTVFKGNNNNQETKSTKLNKLMKKIGIRKKPYVVDLTTKKVTAENLSEAKIFCEISEKDHYLFYFLKSHLGRTLVFTNSIDCIFRLTGVLEVLGCSPLHIHAKMQQRQRLKHLERFQTDPHAVMIASDVAARGLDIPDVKHVVHYQAPRTMETYIHRSGRSARSGKDGLSIMFVSPSEMNFYKRICRSLNKEDGLPLYMINESYMAAVKKRVNVAREIDKMAHKQKKVRLHNDWFTKNAEAMDLALDEDVIIDTTDAQDISDQINSKRQQLAALQKKPIFPKGFSGKFITQRGELFLPSLGADRPKKSKR